MMAGLGLIKPHLLIIPLIRWGECCLNSERQTLLLQKTEVGMQIAELDIKCRAFFDSFMGLYAGWNSAQARKVEVMKQHSLRVSTLAGQLAGALHLEKEDVALARISGLLHDLGMFPQLMSFGTADDDAASDDHAAITLQEIERVRLFENADEGATHLIKQAIRYHNRAVMPDNLTDRELLFVKILRDADKLDHLEVFSTQTTQSYSEVNGYHALQLSPRRGVSARVALTARSGKIVGTEVLETFDDLKVMQLSRIYDLNFKASFRIVAHGRYIDKIYGTLPKRDEVIDIYRVVRIFIENQFLN